jgi:hypothetical protein
MMRLASKGAAFLPLTLLRLRAAAMTRRCAVRGGSLALGAASLTVAHHFGGADSCASDCTGGARVRPRGRHTVCRS